ncbi:MULTISPECIES: hypothetical protein [unclassified Streptomyces]|uniref:TRAFAC clade GTPase domain-containing protein n=1 Tax=unclassified Streptomyces TaxID=2593676 RepID=UPI0036E56F55
MRRPELPKRVRETAAWLRPRAQKAREWAEIALGVLIIPFAVVAGGITFLLLSAVGLAFYYACGVLPRLIWRHLRAVRRLSGDGSPGATATGTEPVRAPYLHRAGPRVFRALCRDVREAYAQEVASALTRDYELFTAKDRPRRRVEALGDLCLGLLGCAYRGCWTLAVILATAVLFLPALLLRLLVWAVLTAAFRLFCELCRAVDRAGRRLTGATTVCPHPDCGRVVALPIRLCPGCGAQHRRLEPDRNGALHRICRCGIRLPAAIVSGVRRLDARCPHCSRAMLRGDCRTHLVLIAGAPGSGRSVVVRSGLTQLARRVRSLRGSVGGGVPGAAATGLFGLRGGRRSLVLLDPPGPAFAEQAELDTVDGLRHADGLLLVLDGPALTAVRRASTTEDRERISSVPRAAQEPVETAERVLRNVASLPADHRPRRIAVVMTKTAALRRTSAGAGLANGDDAVRQWLVTAGAGNLVRVVGESGVPVRFLADEAGADGDTDLGGLLLWTAGIPAAPRRRRVVPPLRVPWPVRGHRHRAARPGPAQHTLLLSHFVGFVSLPLMFVLLLTAALPGTSLFGLPGAFDRWAHPLPAFTHDRDLTTFHQGISWPEFKASYSADGTSPDGPRMGIHGFWSTAGSPSAGVRGASDWLEVDFGVPVPISRVELVLTGWALGGPPTDRLQIRTPNGAGGWVARTVEHDVTSIAPGVAQDEITVGVTATAIRIVVPGGDEPRGVDVGTLRVWSPSNQLLRLRPSGPGLLLTSTVNRAMAVDVRPPVLPPGWRAASAGAPPRRVSAGATVSAGRQLTAEADAQPGPVRYAVRITEDGHTATAVCVAWLTPTASGPRTQPIVCDSG